VFELVELCTPEIAKAVGDNLKRGGGATPFWSCDPTWAILLKKLRKGDYAGDAPVDLLCYADGLLVTPDPAALQSLLLVIGAEGRGPFRAIWFLGEDGAYRVA
jgi:hypothetical protein